jgi:ATP-dependent Clp protease protease subunit
MDVLIDGEIVLYGTVGDDFWEEGFTAPDVLRALAAVGRNNDVTVRINSPGGKVTEGVSIYNALKAHRGRVTVYVDACAASAGSLIAMAGDEIIMRAGSIMMIHDPAALTMGDVREHEKAIETLNLLGDTLAEIYAERTGRDAAEIRDEMREEIWLTGPDAVAKKYADRVETANDNATALEPAAFNYRLFKNAPERFVALADERAWSKLALKAAQSAAPQRQKENTMANDPADKKPATEPQNPAAQAPTAPANVVNIDEVRAQGYAEAVAYISEVQSICALAGAPDKAQAFIDARTKPADVTKALLEARASSDAAKTISNTIPPANGPAPTTAKVDVVANMKRRFGQQ